MCRKRYNFAAGLNQRVGLVTSSKQIRKNEESVMHKDLMVPEDTGRTAALAAHMLLEA